MTTLFLADDDESVRRTLWEFFVQYPRYQIVGEAYDGAAAVEACRRLKPDVALLDIRMPVLDGLRAAKLLLGEELVRCVVMLTAFSDRVYIRDALDAGAFGYLTKPFDPEKILPTLELCIHKSREYHLLKKEHQNLSRRLGERAVVDRAKLVLMETKEMAEDEAYQYIRELSKRMCMSMATVSKYLLAKVEELHE
ncbi:MAG TPA: response regulator [Pseudoflavonifractor sp.]|nr:response regulator [Pseudoflavonifractor sp.]